MKERLTKLIDLKSIITLALTSTLIWGFVMGEIGSREFLVYVTMVLTFYFAKKDNKEEEKKPTNEEVG